MAAASDSLAQAVDLREPSGWRRSKNQIMTVLMWLAFVIVLIPLGFVLVTLVAKGADAISWQFLTNSTIPANIMPVGIGGMGPAVIGTLEITGHLFYSGYSIPAVIANQFGEATGGAFRGGLIGLGLFLFVLTIIVNLVARGIVERSARRARGA